MIKVNSIVVGAGIIGLATAATLKKNNVDVICLDEGKPGNYSSAGDKRIFRHSHEDAQLTKLAKQSNTLWTEWEETLNTELLKRVGHVFPHSEERKDLFEKENLIYLELDKSDVASIIPIASPYNDKYGFDPAGAIIDSRNCVKALTNYLGDNLVADNKVISVDRREGNFYVSSEQKEYEAKHIVLANSKDVNRLANQISIEMPELELTYHLRPDYRISLRAGLPAFSETLKDYSYYLLQTTLESVAVGSGSLSFHSKTSFLPGSAVERKLSAYLVETITGNLPGVDTEILSVTSCPSLRLKSNTKGSDHFAVGYNNGASAIAGGNLFKFAFVAAELLVRDMKKKDSYTNIC